MQEIKGLKVGMAFTGSFCTFKTILSVIENMAEAGAELYPVFSDHVMNMDTRFNQAAEFIEKVEAIAGRKGIKTIQEAEPVGPSKKFDVMVIAPCTGNTMAKLAAGITDTPVLMAAKAHLRNERPLILAVSTNDALGINLKNIGTLINCKNIYFVPFGQDDCVKKPKSLVAHMNLIPDTIITATQGKQIQPVIVPYH